MLTDQYQELLETLCEAFADLELAIEKPELLNIGHVSFYRFKSKSLETAVIQKLARVISGLHAGLLLLATGYYQELAVIFRTLDELQEDILFLCDGLRRDEPTDTHSEYLGFFYQEEFDQPDKPLMSTQKRGMTKRSKIQAAIARMPESEINKSDHQELRRTLGKTFSGYVHAASPQVMDMYVGDPPKFQLRGMLGTSRTQTFNTHFWHRAYGAILSTTHAADALQQKEVVERLYRLRTNFEKQSGRSHWDDPANSLRHQKT